MANKYNPHKEVAFSKSDAKTAALYFDYVRPFMYFPREFDWAFLAMLIHAIDLDLPIPKPFDDNNNASYAETENILKNILPPPLLHDKKINKHYKKAMTSLTALMKETSKIGKIDEKIRKKFGSHWEKLRKHIDYSDYMDVDFGTLGRPNNIESEAQDSINLTISGISGIDTSNIEWEQILEFRKNPDNITAMRDLRLYFHENFEGKSIAYIEDKLGQVADRHNKKIKEWQLGNMISSIEFCRDSKILLPSLVTATIAGVSSLPVTVAIASGVILEVGNIALNIIRKKRDISKIINDQPTRYLINLHSKFDKSSTTHKQPPIKRSQ